MGKRTEDWEGGISLPEYLAHNLKLRLSAGSALDDGNEEDFRNNLSKLYREYFHKFPKKDDIERPDYAEEEQAGVVKPRDIDELNFHQAESLYFKICRLQEELGHTSIETRKFKQREMGR